MQRGLGHQALRGPGAGEAWLFWEPVHFCARRNPDGLDYGTGRLSCLPARVHGAG